MQQEISSNSSAWLDCVIHALPLSILSPWILVGTWSRILDISNVVWQSSVPFLLEIWEEREPCSVHACVRIWELSSSTVHCAGRQNTSQNQTPTYCKNHTRNAVTGEVSDLLVCVQKAKLLMPLSADQYLQVHGCLEASHHIILRKCSTVLGYLSTETKPRFSTVAELCVSKLFPLVLLAISWPGKRHICGGVGSPTSQYCGWVAQGERGAMEHWEPSRDGLYTAGTGSSLSRTNAVFHCPVHRLSHSGCVKLLLTK